MNNTAGGRAPGETRPTRFSRFEYKYRLPRGMAESVRACVAAHLPLDRYSESADDGYYDISSLYLDSADLRLCRESLAGQKNRFKLRIRAYDDEPANPVFLEVKRRLNSVIVKDRVPMPRDQLGRLADPTGGCQEDGAQQFHLYRNLLAAQPQSLVRYQRLAYEGAGHNRVRVTFDRDLSCRLCSQWAVEVHGGLWRRVLADQVVLEIKFDGRFPSWVQELVRRFQLQAQSVSKYCLGLQTSTPAALGYLMKPGLQARAEAW